MAGHYDQKCDIWSIGIISYILLCGYPPFYADNNPELFRLIKEGKFDFYAEDWKDISDDAKDLIKRLLKQNPEDRMTAEEALQHPWITEKRPKSFISKSVLKRLRKFRKPYKLQKEALMIIVNGLMGEKDLERMKMTFEALDTDHNGFIDVEKFKTAFQFAGYNEEEASEFVKELESKGKLNYSEFLTATVDKSKVINKETLKAVFK